MQNNETSLQLLGLVLDLTWNTSTLIALAGSFAAILKQWWRDRERLDSLEQAIKADRAMTEGVKQDVLDLKQFLTTNGGSTSSLNCHKINSLDEQMQFLASEMTNLKQIVLAHLGSKLQKDSAD